MGGQGDREKSTRSHEKTVSPGGRSDLRRQTLVTDPVKGFNEDTQEGPREQQPSGSGLEAAHLIGGKAEAASPCSCRSWSLTEPGTGGSLLRGPKRGRPRNPFRGPQGPSHGGGRAAQGHTVARPGTGRQGHQEIRRRDRGRREASQSLRSPSPERTKRPWQNSDFGRKRKLATGPFVELSLESATWLTGPEQPGLGALSQAPAASTFGSPAFRAWVSGGRESNVCDPVHISFSTRSAVMSRGLGSF